jgi:hypothetical protein
MAVVLHVCLFILCLFSSLITGKYLFYLYIRIYKYVALAATSVHMLYYTSRDEEAQPPFH